MRVIFLFFTFGILKREKDKKAINRKNDKKSFAFIVMSISYIEKLEQLDNIDISIVIPF